MSSLANTGMSFTKVDEREKQAALEEEQARLKALKVRDVFFSSRFRKLIWMCYSNMVYFSILTGTEVEGALEATFVRYD